MLVRLSNNGHYPDRFVEVFTDELTAMRALEEKYGYLQSPRIKGREAEFVLNIMERSTVRPPYEHTVTLYE